MGVREEGDWYFADVLVVPRDEEGLVENIGRATKEALELDWRLHDLVVMPVREMPDDSARPETGREAPDSGTGRGALEEGHAPC